jgi:division protein 1
MIVLSSLSLLICYEVRTGQAHRTLLGHTGPVSCLQFDEIHIASGSLDKTIRVSRGSPLLSVAEIHLVKIWDLRAGGVYETLTYDHAVTGLQFDTRKVVAATGENGLKVRIIFCHPKMRLTVPIDL